MLIIQIIEEQTRQRKMKKVAFDFMYFDPLLLQRLKLKMSRQLGDGFLRPNSQCKKTATKTTSKTTFALQINNRDLTTGSPRVQQDYVRNVKLDAAANKPTNNR